MRILFVENHAVFAGMVVREFLAGHEVIVVSSAAGAEAAIESSVEPFDVALVDYDLDDGKGDRLVRSLRRGGFASPIVATSAHERGNELLAAAGADAVCAKGDFDRIAEVLREVRSKAPRASRPAAPAPDLGGFERLAIHARSEGPRWGRVLVAREEGAWVRRVGRSEVAEPVPAEAVAELADLLAGSFPDRPDLENLGLDLDLAVAAGESLAGRWSSPAELEAALGRYYAPAPGEPSCQVRVRIETAAGRRAQVDSESDRAYMLPFTVQRPGGVVRAFDARIARALARLVPPGFPNRERLEGGGLEAALVEGRADEAPELVAPDAGPLTPLMTAAREGRLEEVKRLLAEGAGVAATDARGWSALVHAIHGDSLRAEMNLLKTTQALLDAGADPAARDDDGRSALDHVLEVEAERRFVQEVVQALGSPATKAPGSVGPHRSSLRRLLESRG